MHRVCIALVKFYFLLFLCNSVLPSSDIHNKIHPSIDGHKPVSTDRFNPSD